MADLEMEAAIFFEPYLPNALRRALEYAGDDGFVASMPQLLHARVNADYDNIIWNTWFTSNTEESVVTTPQLSYRRRQSASCGTGLQQCAVTR